MKITALSRRLMLGSTLVYAFLILVVLLIVHAAFSDEPRVERGLDVFVVTCIVLGAVRMWLPGSQCWVRIDGGMVAWRANKALVARGCTPTGSVALAEVSAVRVVVQDQTLGRSSRTIRGHRATLVLADGRTVVLPIFSAATSRAPMMDKLLDALRAGCPASVEFDDTVLPPRSPSAAQAG